MEIIFTLIKSLLLQKQLTYSLYIVIFSFIIESLSGLALTTIQVVSIWLNSSLDHAFLEYKNGNKNGFIWSSVLFIVSEVVTIISEILYLSKILPQLGVFFPSSKGDRSFFGEVTVISSLILLIFSSIHLRVIENIDSHAWGHLLLTRLILIGFILIYVVVLYAFL